MKKILVSLVSIVCIISLILVGCSNVKENSQETSAQAEKQYKMRLMHTYPETTQHGRNSHKFKELVERETNGRITVEIYPNAQLGAIDKEVGMVQSGAVEAAYSINGAMETLDPIEAIYTLPFFWKSNPGSAEYFQTAAKYDSPIENYLRENAKQYGIYRLGTINTLNGMFIAANNAHEVKRPEDMEGLKIRHAGGMLGTFQIESFGASPITMSGADVPVALTQNVMDGLQTGVNHFHDSQWHTKYVTANYVISYSLPLILNLAWYESLPEDLQDILQNKVIPELQEYANTETNKGELETLELMQQEPYNVKVTILSDEEIEQYWANHNDIRNKGIEIYVSKTGEAGQKLIEEATKIIEGATN